MNFRTFSIEVPKESKKVKVKGVDSYIGPIVIDGVDTLHFDYGWYSNKLEEDLPQIISKSEFDTIDVDKLESEYIVIESFEHFDLETILKNKVRYDTINGLKSEIVSPKKSGKGLTGVYFDNIERYGSGKIRFNLYGVNLKSENEKLALKSFETIKFKKK